MGWQTGGNTTVSERLSLMAAHNEKYIFQNSPFAERQNYNMFEGEPKFQIKKSQKRVIQSSHCTKSNPRHVLPTHQFIQKINFTCSRNRFFYIYFQEKISYVIYEGKTIILVQCSFHHNTSSARSKNWWDGRREAIQRFLSVSASQLHATKKIPSKLHLSLSDRIIIGLKEGQNFRFS